MPGPLRDVILHSSASAVLNGFLVAWLCVVGLVLFGSVFGALLIPWGRTADRDHVTAEALEVRGFRAKAAMIKSKSELALLDRVWRASRPRCSEH